MKDIKQKLIERGLKQGYLSADEISEYFKDDNEGYLVAKEAYEQYHIEIVDYYTAFGRKLKTNKQRILYCYFLFKCEIFDEEIDLNSFNPDIVKNYVYVIDEFVKKIGKKVSKEYGEKLTRILYGLDSGNKVLRPMDAFEQLKYDYINDLIESYADIIKFIKSDSKEKEKLKNQINNILRFTNIDNYKIIDGKIYDDEQGILFTPFDKDNKRVEGLFAYTSECNIPEIGYRSLENITHSMFFTDDGWVFHTSFSKRIPDIVISSEDGNLRICLAYPGRNFHGKVYTFYKDSPTSVKTYDRGHMLNEYHLDFKVDLDFVKDFTFKTFKENDITKDVKKNKTQYVLNEDGTYKLEVSSNKAGNMSIGRSNGKTMEGTFLLCLGEEDSAYYCVAEKGRRKKGSPILRVYGFRSKDPRFELEYKNKEGLTCSLAMQYPFDLIAQLAYTEYDKDGNQKKIVLLSDPTEIRLEDDSNDTADIS